MFNEYFYAYDGIDIMSHFFVALQITQKKGAPLTIYRYNDILKSQNYRPDDIQEVLCHKN